MSLEFFKSDYSSQSSRFIIEAFKHDMWSEFAVEELLFVVASNMIGIEIVCAESWKANALGNKILEQFGVNP